MRYGFISRRNKETIKEHTEALKTYDLAENIVDNFEGELDYLFEKLKTGDSLFMEEPPRDTIKFIAIYSYTHKHGIKLYIQGELIGDLPPFDMFDELVKREIAKRRRKVK